MIGKKLINTGGAAVENLPSGYFNTVTYTGNGGTQRIGGYINRGALFNGSTSKINLNSRVYDVALEGQLTEFSFSLWVYMDTAPTGSQNILSWWSSTAYPTQIKDGFFWINIKQKS